MMKTMTVNNRSEKRKIRWWRIPIIILAVVGAGSLLLNGCGKVMENIQSVPENYTTTVKTAGELEAKYMAMGSHEVSYFESYAMMSFQKYEIFYPSDIADIDKQPPVVVFVNGTGIKGSKYKALQKHMASWGFITIATEEDFAWNGFSAEMSVRFLEKLNSSELFDNKDNVFYQKINLNNIGITGHSQGGYGVVNAITVQKHAASYKAAVILSSDASFSGNDFMWDADSTLIKTPSLIVGSTGEFDSVVASLENLQGLYSNIQDGTTKVLARRNDADHGQMLYYADGYVTAWFMYYLQDDEEAKAAFFTNDAEILTNPLYQNQQIYQAK
ncbi:poly(ethylene terephthalate) hydrolase family protein [Paenibacillus riograndensis]|uniref:Lipase n=2 Tax=Paenibacillus riograndensis TaxID=483937 RepID=A0A0E3WHC1_9BACL|nr:alpha/beta hydrolase [Paenibacillus riograndensis]CQR55028.1 lipase [Paenibacillus riograndensis SBR5]